MSLQAMIDAAPYGALLLVPAGDYAEAVTISRPLTLRAAGPVRIRCEGAVAGIRVAASYVNVEGPFDIMSPGGDGIEADFVHHVAIRGVTCHDCGESGIQFNFCEFVTVEDCTCYGNARLSWFSGISVYECRDIAGDTAFAGFRTVIRNNVCHDNWTFAGTPTDGNGIIIDDMNSTQNGNFPPYPHPTLVENNLCYRNGGKGIAIHWSDRVTVRHNTVEGNNGDPRNEGTWRGDLSNQSSRNGTFESNVCVCDPATHPASTAIGCYGDENTGNEWTANLAWPPDRALNTPGSNNRIRGTLIADPALVDFVPTNPAAAALGWRPATPRPLAAPPSAPPGSALFALYRPAAVLDDVEPYELGTQIDFGPAGTIRALRLFRVNSDPQEMRVWRDGKVVATAAVPGGAPGWVESGPVEVAVAAGERLVVSTGKPAGRSYAADNGALAVALAGPAFTIPASGGVFATATGEFPTQAFRDTYYWTDVVFDPAG